MVRVGKLLGVLPEMIPDNLAEAAELKETISRRHFAPSDEGREMTRALIEMLEKNSPPLLDRHSNRPDETFHRARRSPITSASRIVSWKNIWPALL